MSILTASGVASARNTVLALLSVGLPALAYSATYHMVFPIEGIPYKTPENDIVLYSNEYCGTAYETLADLQAGGLPCVGAKPANPPSIELSTMDGYINLDYTGYSSLNFLSTLTTLNGTLQVRSMGNLTDLTGLDNLSGPAYKITVNYNTNLESLVGLGNITELTFQLGVTNNAKITSLAGLDSLQRVNTLLVNSSNLLDLSGAPNLNYVRKIVGYGSDFTSLTGLEGLTYIDRTYDFHNSAALTNVNALINITGTSDSGTGEKGLLLYGSPLLDDVSGLQNIAAGQISLDLRDYAIKAPGTSPLCQNFNTGDDITGVVVQGWDGTAFSPMTKSYVCSA